MADSKTPSRAPQDHEHGEPGDMSTHSTSGMESPPIWMWGVIFAALFGGVYFLGANLGNIGPDPWPKAAIGDGAVMTVAQTPALDGAPIYSARCIVCHQQGGTGMPGIFPPLTNSDWVTGNPENVVRIILQGIGGPIDVAGQSYNSVMPGLATQLSDEEIAAVVTHIRGSFGNTASAVSTADVARIRGEGRSAPWTAEELQGMSGPTPAATPVVAAATPSPVPAAAKPATAVVNTSSGGDGASLFAQFACNTCHAVDNPAAMVGPSLYDVGQRLSTAEIYESIVDPDAIITEGYSPGMMSAMVSTMNFTGTELNKMVKYLAGLKG